jgi:hypothetical protein
MTTSSLTTVSTDNAADVIREIENAFWDIPFENSAFQTENFVLASQITPERAYRAIGLRMHKKLIAVQESIIGQEKAKIELEQLQEKLASPDYDKYEKRIMELEQQKRDINKRFHQKLLNDAITELNVLYKHFKALPKYTREEFEAGEKRHFLESLNRQSLGIVGPKESLINMFDDAQALNKFESEFKLIANNYDTDLLLELTENSLTNVSKETIKEQK